MNKYTILGNTLQEPSLINLVNEVTNNEQYICYSIYEYC